MYDKSFWLLCVPVRPGQPDVECRCQRRINCPLVTLRSGHPDTVRRAYIPSNLKERDRAMSCRWRVVKLLTEQEFCFVCFCRESPQWGTASSFTRFLDPTQRCTTVGRTPLDQWSARRRDLSLTTHNNRNRKTSMPPVGFEPASAISERRQTYALDRAAAGIGYSCCIGR